MSLEALPLKEKEMIRDIYKRLKAGETIHVQVPDSGKQFSIQPESWEGFVLGYSLVENGKRVKGYSKKVLNESIHHTTYDLIEVEQ